MRLIAALLSAPLLAVLPYLDGLAHTAQATTFVYHQTGILPQSLYLEPSPRIHASITIAGNGGFADLRPSATKLILGRTTSATSSASASPLRQPTTSPSGP